MGQASLLIIRFQFAFAFYFASVVLSFGSFINDDAHCEVIARHFGPTVVAAGADTS